METQHEPPVGRWIIPAALLFALMLLASCRGIPTAGEKQSRALLEQTGATFRSHDQKPVLPVLTTNSMLRDYLAFAMLNQPKVASAYYEWAAAVEGITIARAFPDPQFTFQMDVQN